MTESNTPLAAPVVDLSIFRDQVVIQKIKEEFDKLPPSPTGSQLFNAILRAFPQNSPMTW